MPLLPSFILLLLLLLLLLLINKVKYDEFWKDLTPMTFGDLPNLLEDVSVVGYPIGGDSLSVTAGVVSRIELTEYAQVRGVRVRRVRARVRGVMVSTIIITTTTIIIIVVVKVVFQPLAITFGGGVSPTTATMMMMMMVMMMIEWCEPVGHPD